MTEEEIKTTIVELLTQSLAGQEIERNKIDFKYEWYDLTDINGIYEFLKDTTSIANSVGPGGFIAIGFDEKGKTFKDSKFEDCKLRDYSDISGIFAKRLSNIINTEIYNIEYGAYKLNIIYIPPCLQKPVLIKSYQKKDQKGIIKEEANKIFVRRNANSVVANKEEIELMYWDRKNIEPEYLVEIFSLTPNKHSIGHGDFFVQININIENRGSRSLAFSNYRLRLIEEDDTEIAIPAVKVWIKEIGKSYAVGSATEIVAPNQIKDICIDFGDSDANYLIYNKLFNPKIKTFISLSTTNGKVFEKELNIVRHARF